MKASERDQRIEELFREDMELLKKKGHDYSGDEDCLRNFRDFGSLGILIRLSDKFIRLKNLVRTGSAQVGDESAVDTLRDIRNYSFLMQIVMEEEDRAKSGR